MTDLTHLDEHGAERMADVSDKAVSGREAVAEAVIVLSAEAFAAAVSGDVLAAARIAGIMAAKKTSELIPLCHPIPLSKAGVEFEPLAARNAIRIVATARTHAPKGVEMEALTAASIAALTIYDMVKAVDKSTEIESVRLLTKSDGKSGTCIAPQRTRSARTTPAPRLHTAALTHEAAPAKPRNDPNAQREAFRAFMVSHQLRATEWAKQAGVPPSVIYSFLTGHSGGMAGDAAEKLAKAARVRVEDMFAAKR